jgi:hypothetical protein
MANEMSKQYPDPAGAVIKCYAGSESVIQDYGSADPDPKELFTDPQHCFPYSFDLMLDIIQMIENKDF